MARKSHHTAVAALPPPEVWEPIQAIRRVHDRQIGRWMPHINLLYPFVPVGDVEKAVPLLVEACASVPPFAVTRRQQVPDDV